MSFHRSITTLGFFTLLSRFLGFVRDLLTATLLGAGPIADAFVVAQRIPYAFRAFFAEGAIDTAFVPVYATKLHQEGPAKAEVLARQVFTLVCLVILPFTLLCMVFMPQIVSLLAPGFTQEAGRFQLAVMYSRVTFFYLALISVTALQGAIMNAHGKFMPAALAQVALNAVMIAGLLLAWALGLDIGWTGCFAMVAGGFVQLILLYVFCRKQNISPLGFTSSLLSPDVKKFVRLLGSGIAVTGSFQIYAVLSTILASSLPAGAVSALYYADRLNQLPLGVIGSTIGTALLPVLMRHIAAKEDKETGYYFSRALEIGLILSLPACLIMVLAAEPIVTILFQHGVFDANDTKLTAQSLWGYALDIPAAVMARTLMVCFFARGKMKAPVTAIIVMIIVNIILAKMLMPSLQHLGVALASSGAAWVETGILAFVLIWRGHFKVDDKLLFRLPRLLLAATAMGLTLWLSAPMGKVLGLSGLLGDIVALTMRLLLSGTAYLAAIRLTGALRFSDVMEWIKPSQRA